MTATYSLSGLRVLVSEEEAEAQAYGDPLETYDGWIRPATIADLEGLGEKVWWCEEHRSSVPDGNEPDGTCERSMSEWESAYPGFKAKPCRMVEKLLITQQRGSE